jgi:hypothetical protein
MQWQSFSCAACESTLGFCHPADVSFRGPLLCRFCALSYSYMMELILQRQMESSPTVHQLLYSTPALSFHTDQETARVLYEMVNKQLKENQLKSEENA